MLSSYISYLEVGRARDVKVRYKAVYVGENAVPLLCDAVQSDHWDDFLRGLLGWRLIRGRISRQALSSCHIDVHPLRRSSIEGQGTVDGEDQV